MHPSLRKTLASLCVLGAVAAGGAAIAGAASNGSSSNNGGSSSNSGSTARPSDPSGQPPRRPNETALTGTTADKVKKAALARVPGATVLRVETDADQGAAYEAHVRKSDGTQVTVLVDKSFKVVAVRSCGPGRGGPGDPRGAGYGGPPPPPAGGYQQGGYPGPAPYGAVPN